MSKDMLEEAFNNGYKYALKDCLFNIRNMETMNNPSIYIIKDLLLKMIKEKK